MDWSRCYPARDRMGLPREKAAGVVLLVDDDDAVRRVFRRVLVREGHEVVEAESATEAIAVLENKTVDVVITDINMPDTDGVVLLQRIKGKQPEVSVLLMTGAPQLETAVKAVEFGAFEYMSKPIEVEKLQSSVHRAIAQSRAASEQRRLADSAHRLRSTTPAIERIHIGAVLATKYRLVRVIGEGGMGIVYEAERDDGTHVAVKVLHEQYFDRPDVLARFHREAHVVSELGHPHIVEILDFHARDDGFAFLVMELLHGRSLARAIEDDTPFSEKRVAAITTQILSALGAAHHIHVIHRDLKPENVFLLEDDRVKLLDFGMAKHLDGSEQKLTETGVVVGTPAYLPPEQARGEKPEVRGDIYSLGCVMYEMLTRVPPFDGANYNALLFAIQHRPARPIATVRENVSPDFAHIVERAMSKKASDRYASAEEMSQALASFV